MSGNTSPTSTQTNNRSPRDRLSWLCASPGPGSPLARLFPNDSKIQTCVGERSPCFWSFIVILTILFIVFVALFGIRGASILLLPAIPLSLRYMWWRLVWEPFGDSKREEGEKEGGWCAATRDLCSPWRWRSRTYSKRYVAATVCFWMLLLMSVLGLMLAETVGGRHVNTLVFLAVCYNAGGAIMLLIVAIWIVDAVEFCLEVGFALVLSCFSGDDARWNGHSSVVDGGVGVGGLEEEHDIRNGGEVLDDTPSSAISAHLMQIEDGRGLSVQPQQEEEKNGGRLSEDTVLFTNHTPHNSIIIISKMTKLFFIRVKAVTSIFLFVIMLAVSSADSYGEPRIISFDLPLRKLPTCLDGFKLAMVADIHAGAMTGSFDVRRITELVLDYAPDAVAIVGDLGDQEVNAALQEKLASMAALETVPYGVYWTPGNHENYMGIEDYREIFASNNTSSSLNFVRALENSHRTIEYSTHTTQTPCAFDIAGLADPNGELEPDIDVALRGRDTSNALVLLNHQPLHFDKYVKAGTGLMLSGHTHGGQIWPNHSIIWGYYGKYIAGLFSSSQSDQSTSSSTTEGSAYLYVSEGAVSWGPRVRFLSYPEIAYITLRSPAVFENEGGSTSGDEAPRAAVVGIYVGLVLLPLSIVLCILRSYGFCHYQGRALQGVMKCCGFEGEKMRDV